MSTPTPGPTAATAMDAASPELCAPFHALVVTLCENISAGCFRNDALNPHAARVGMATYNWARELPKWASAATRSAAFDFTPAAEAGSNSGTATLEHTTRAGQRDRAKLNLHKSAHEKFVPRVRVVLSLCAILNNGAG